MTIRFLTLGCKLNFAESSALGKALLQRGFKRCKEGEPANICVVNTCSVTDTADKKDRQAIHRIRRENPDALLIVTGCYAQLQPQRVGAIKGVDIVLGAHEKFDIDTIIQQAHQREEADIQVGDINQVRTFRGAVSAEDRTRCFLKVQDGCDYYCTYCTIPMARGRSRNPRIQEVVVMAQEALRNGAKELVLTGVNTGDFGKSTGEHFIDLLRALDQIEGEFRIRISSCEPNLLSDEIIDFVAQSHHFAPHFHLPLQSGSNRMLEIMHRRYTRELFAERVAHIRRVMPHAFIGVDTMVGVRGETEEIWQEYLEFVRGLDISQLHVFTYSERTGTHMLRMDLEVIPAMERARRSKELHRISEDKLRSFYEAHATDSALVLWEGKKIARRNRRGETEYFMEGFTENYIRKERPWDESLVNQFSTI